MSGDTSFGDAVDLLARLCERQQEISTSAHLSVMQAFNACAAPALLPPMPPREARHESIEALLRRTAAALGELAARAAELGQYAVYAEAHAHIVLAIEEL